MPNDSNINNMFLNKSFLFALSVAIVAQEITALKEDSAIASSIDVNAVAVLETASSSTSNNFFLQTIASPPTAIKNHFKYIKQNNGNTVNTQSAPICLPDGVNNEEFGNSKKRRPIKYSVRNLTDEEILAKRDYEQHQISTHLEDDDTFPSTSVSEHSTEICTTFSESSSREFSSNAECPKETDALTATSSCKLKKNYSTTTTKTTTDLTAIHATPTSPIDFTEDQYKDFDLKDIKAPEPTLVLVTGIDEDGIAKIIVSSYSQIFREAKTDAEIPPRGTIGLGAIDGVIGTVRTYEIVTETLK